MQNYLNLLSKIIAQGASKDDRTGTGVYSLFAERLEFDLNQGLPLLTTKKVYYKGILAELLWFLRGDTNIKYLHDNNCHIWDEWADEKGNIGPLYGAQWRNWQGASGAHDQISDLLQGLIHRPNSRRHLISTWNVALLPTEAVSPHENVKLGKMALAPCHVLAQFYIHAGALSAQVYLRSQDFFLGTPFNIASYAFLTYLIAHQLNLKVDKLIWVGGDVHLYHNHLEQAKQQLSRPCAELPSVKINVRRPNIWDYEINDFEVLNYNPAPSIKAPIAV